MKKNLRTWLLRKTEQEISDWEGMLASGRPQTREVALTNLEVLGKSREKLLAGILREADPDGSIQ